LISSSQYSLALVVLAVAGGIGYQQIDTTAGEEETMRGVQDLLPAEVPKAQDQILFFECVDLDALGRVAGFDKLRPVFTLEQGAQQLGLACISLAHHQNARFAQFAPAFFVHAAVVGEDVLGVMASLPLIIFISKPFSGDGNLQRVVPQVDAL
jgi:hypothetical protein